MSFNYNYHHIHCIIWSSKRITIWMNRQFRSLSVASVCVNNVTADGFQTNDNTEPAIQLRTNCVLFLSLQIDDFFYLNKKNSVTPTFGSKSSGRNYYIKTVYKFKIILTYTYTCMSCIVSADCRSRIVQVNNNPNNKSACQRISNQPTNQPIKIPSFNFDW